MLVFTLDVIVTNLFLAGRYLPYTCYHTTQSNGSGGGEGRYVPLPGHVKISWSNTDEGLAIRVVYIMKYY